MIKRVVDLVAASLGLVLLSPFLGIIALAIRLEGRGGVLFRQVRVGKHGVEFEIIKFRSMRSGSGGLSVTSTSDGRITRVGHIIRSAKLDELPQLMNVLRGQMSLVGPRPEVPEYVAQWPLRDREIVLSVRPGITDPASLEFRREAEILSAQVDPEGYYIDEIIPRKLALYRSYVQNRSTVGDFRILAHTLQRTIVG